ncbi:MAG: hypothetical protein N2Z67_06620, partial [Acetobacteraceae bacterium]|nr:hypothetical protein [Acetobacteraceae bacterium]
MAVDRRAKRTHQPWQVMEQKETEGRGGFEEVGSNQPKPRARRRQTAQSARGAGANGMIERRRHAALAM